MMLGNTNAYANIPVRNIDTARRFYEETLGLEPVGSEGDEVITYRSGNSTLLVYRSQFAGTNRATTVTWPVGDDVEGIVQALKDQGVKFEHYDMPDTQRVGDIHVSGEIKVAWFKDPDGNILNIVSR